MSAEKNEPRRRWLRRTLWIAGIAFALLLIVSAVVPGWLSSDAGRGWLFRAASDAIPGRFGAEDIDLNWTDGQKLRKLELTDANGNPVAKVRSLETSYSLLQLVGGDYSGGKVVIEGLELDLRLDDEGGLNLAAAVSGRSEKSEPVDARTLLRELVVELPPSLKLTVELRDARISLSGPGFEQPFRLTQVNGTLFAAGSGEPVKLDLRGIVGRASEASLGLELAGFDSEGRLQASNAQLKLTLDASWAAGDQAGRTVKALRSLLGPTTKLELELATAPDSLTVSTSTLTPFLEVKGGATLDLKQEEHVALRVDKPIEAHYRVTPALLREFATGDAKVDLEKEFDLDVALDSFAWASDSKTFEAAASVALGDGVVKVRVGEITQMLDWADWAASVKAGGPDGIISASLTGRVLDGEVSMKADGKSAESGKVRATVRQLPLAAIDRVLQCFTARAGVLVDWLGPELNLEARFDRTDPDTASARISVKTARLDLELPLAMDQKAGTISGANASVRYALAPGLVPGIANEEDLAIQLRADSFRLPLSGFDPKLTAVNATLTIGSTTLAGPTPVVLEGFECHIASESLAKSVALEADGKVDGGSLKVNGNFDGLWNEAGTFQLETALGTLDVILSDFPIGRIEPALGERIDASVRVKANGSEARIDIDCRSDLLTANLPLQIANRRARLREPGGIVRYQVTPKTARDYASLELKRPFDVELSLGPLDLALDAVLDPDETTLDAHVQIKRAEFAALYDGHDVTFHDLDIAIQGETLAKAKATIATAAEVSGIDLGGPLVLFVSGNREGGWVTLKSSRVSLTASVERREGLYTLVKPAPLDLRIDPALLDALKIRSDWLSGPLTMKALVSRLAVPENLDLARLATDLKITLGEASLRAGERPVKLGAASIGIKTEGRDLLLDVTASVGDGGIVARGSMKDWVAGGQLNRAAPIEFRAEVLSLPTGLLAADLEPLIGETVAINARVDLPQGIEDQAGTVRLDVRAPRLTANAHLRSDNGFVLAEPARLTWTLTPAALRTLLPKGDLRLREATQVSATVERFRWTGDGELVVVGKALVPQLSLLDKQGEATTVRDLELNVSLPAADRPMQVRLAGAMEGGSKPGSLAGDLFVRNVAQIRDLDKLSIRGTLSFTNIAVAPIDGLLGLDGYLPAVLGAEASAALTLQLVDGLGPVDLQLTSGNLKADIAARVTPDAYLLREPIAADLVYSKPLADKVLPKLGPFFQGIAATEKPIVFRVDKKGFRVPREFAFDRLVVPRAMLDIGKVTLENKMLVQLVKQLARSSVKEKTTAWFTPVEVKIQGGVVRYTKRLDLMFDREVHLATWGTADIGRNRLDMIIGIMPVTLNRVLGIKRAGANDTLRVPVRGTLDKPKFDLGRTLRNVAAIRAKEEAVNRLGGFAGKLAEGALNSLLKKSFAGAPPVPAAVDPLPWVDPDVGR